MQRDQRLIDRFSLIKNIPRRVFAHFVPVSSAAAESERGESLHGECGQEAGHHGPADQVQSACQTLLSEGEGR